LGLGRGRGDAGDDGNGNPCDITCLNAAGELRGERVANIVVALGRGRDGGTNRLSRISHRTRNEMGLGHRHCPSPNTIHRR
jgi:hypothetical protein